MSHESELMVALAEELDRLRGGLSERRGRGAAPAWATGFDPAAPLLSPEAFSRLAARSLREHVRNHGWLAVVVVRPDAGLEPPTLPDGPACLDLAVWDRIGALRLRHALRVDDPVADHGPGSLVCLIPHLRHEADAASVCRRLERHLGQAVGRVAEDGTDVGADPAVDAAADLALDRATAASPFRARSLTTARLESQLAPQAASSRVWEVRPRLGMACFPRDGEHIESLVAKAEARLNTGRRRMEAPSTAWSPTPGTPRPSGPNAPALPSTLAPTLAPTLATAAYGAPISATIA